MSSGLSKISSTYWIITVCVIPVMYLETMGWLVGASQHLSTRFKFGDPKAGNHAALISLLPAFLSLFLAHIVDLKGKKA